MTTRGDKGVVTEIKVEGDELAKEVARQIATEKDSAKLLEYALDGYPANVIKGAVVKEPKRTSNGRSSMVPPNVNCLKPDNLRVCPVVVSLSVCGCRF